MWGNLIKLKQFKLFSILIFLTLIVSSASAVNLIVSDANGSPQAGRGEDVNLEWWNSGTQISGDYNYIVRAFYRGVYADLNVRADQNNTTYPHTSVDINITDTTCANAKGNYHVFSVHRDRNTFNVDVNFTIPATFPTNIITQLQLWQITTTSYDATGGVWNGTCAGYSNSYGSLIVTPAIILSRIGGNIDSNITVFGFGFKPSNHANVDYNLRIAFRDGNGTRVDLNVLDVNYSDVNAAISANPQFADVNLWWWKRTSVKDVNFFAEDNRNIRTGPDYNLSWVNFSDGNRAVKFSVDFNGDFDVNIIVPPTVSMAFTPGVLPDTNISVRDSNNLKTPNVDANRMVVIFPSITLQTDLNITVRICDGNRSCTESTKGDSNTFRYPIDYAMMNNLIPDTNAVKGIMVEMCDGTCTTAGTPLIMRAIMANDLNLAKAARRDYGTNMGADQGAGGGKRANINSAAMPEFKIDANITFFNIKSKTGEMPTPQRDGTRCPTSICSNFIWAYNTVAKDGNLTFQVAGFSEYYASQIDMNVVSPNGGEKIRDSNGFITDGNVMRTDINYRITFHFTDANVDDINEDGNGTGNYGSGVSRPLDVNIFVTRDTNGNAKELIFSDANLFDNAGIVCSPDFTDRNLQTHRSCSVDWNIQADFNAGKGAQAIAPRTGLWTSRLVGSKRIGVYGYRFLDINISDRNGGWFVDRSDANFQVNPPRVNVWDTNLNNNTTKFAWNAGSGQKYKDTNLVVDFNIFVPDGNLLNDLNLTVYYASTNSTRDGNISRKDMNLGDFNVMNARPFRCTDYNGLHINGLGPSTRNEAFLYMDSNCKVDLNLSNLSEANYYFLFEVRDKNGLIDSNYNVGSVAVNDVTNPTVSISGPATGSTTTTDSVTVTASASDATSGIKTYWFSTDGTTWASNGTSNSRAYTGQSSASHTYYVKVSDYADNNSATVQTTITVAVAGNSSGVSSGGSGGGSSGGSSGGSATSETVLSETSSQKPTADEIRNILTEAGASETAIEKASAAVGKTTVERTVEVIKSTAANGSISYSSKITIKVSNPSKTKNLQNVKVIENIPKSVAQSASDISVSEYEFNVLKNDPIIEVVIPEILAGSDATITYQVPKELKSSDISGWSAPIVAEFSEVNAPVEKPVVETPTETPTGTEQPSNEVPQETPAADNTLLYVAVAVVVIAGAAYFFLRKKK